MSLAEVPLLLCLVGLAAYAVLGGADFGAGFWFLLGGRGDRGERTREHTFNAMGPVWEANHVWLIFVLVVCWTAYPVAFASIASTLAVPLFIATIGIILRGTAYALRSGNPTRRQDRIIGLVFSVSSLLTPFALGTTIGGIASGRVPVGNAEGDLFTSWLNPTSLLIGTVAVASAAYLAAVFLAADARRQENEPMAIAFRQRALASGLVAGAIALGGLLVLRHDATHLFDGLTEGAGLAALLGSVVAGIATLALVAGSRSELARYTAALAVASIIAGWGIAQSPTFLPGLTVEDAAAGNSTLVPLLVGMGIGAFVLLPSLFVLFRLVLGGRFDPRAARASGSGPIPRADETNPALLRITAILACGAALVLVLATTPWLQISAAVALLGAIAGALPRMLIHSGEVSGAPRNESATRAPGR
jgi:cytochrome bd ubiquinol oxidase subunit II